MAEQEQRCPNCRSRRYARIVQQDATGAWVPGPDVRCIECKTVRRFYASPDAVNANKAVAEDPVGAVQPAFAKLEAVSAQSHRFRNGEMGWLMPDDEWQDLKEAIASSVPPPPAPELAVMRAALQNAAGFLDTPVMRRRHAADWLYAPTIESIRTALTAPAPDKALMPEAAVGAHVDLLTQAVGDITAALMLAGQEDRIESWTRPYVQVINLVDAAPSQTVSQDRAVEAAQRLPAHVDLIKRKCPKLSAVEWQMIYDDMLAASALAAFKKIEVGHE